MHTTMDSLKMNDAPETSSELEQENHVVIQNITDLNSATPAQLPSRVIAHRPNAGLNPLADAAAYLFSILGKLKHLGYFRQLGKLQKELIQEIASLHDTIINLGYNNEYSAICRYILCATADDIIANTAWGSQNQWASYSLLAAFNQDIHHQDKFFIILERTMKEQTIYIDLMELIYICLSLGYKGQYRSTEYSQYQLEQIINNLYKHIQAYRGHFTKTLSPAPFKTIKSKKKVHKKNTSMGLYLTMIVFCVTAAIFFGLDYLTDVIANETYQTLTQITHLDSSQTTTQL